MAILIEERESSGGMVNLIIWLVILSVIGASVYYIFFKKPELVEFTASSSFNNIQQLSRISINSDKLINDQQFQSLKQYVTVTPPENVGRNNPFLAF